MNDEIAPRPLPIWRYFAAGAIISAESRGVVLWRMMRAVPALIGMALPVLAMAVVMRIASVAPASRVEAIGSLSSRVDRVLAIVPATADVLAVIVGVFLLVGVRGAFDALLYGRLREVASGTARPPSVRIRSGYVAHSGMALLSFGLYVGAVMFTSPVVRAMARVTVERAGSPEATTFGVIGVVIVLSAIAWVRILSVVASCWIAWRPRFLAATLVAALTEPIRRFRIYGSVLVVWLVGHASAVGIAGLSVHALVGPDGRLLEAVPPMAGITLGAAAALGLAVTSWVECTLLVIIGHRLGEVDVARTRRSNRRSTTMSTAPMNEAGFVPAVRGGFIRAPGTGRTDAPSIVSWSDLGHAASPSTWDLGAAAGMGKASGVHTTAAGDCEIVLAVDDKQAAAETMDASFDGLDGDDASVESAPTLVVSAPVETSTPGHSGTRISTPSISANDVGRARYRTAAGGVEVSWRPSS